MKKSITILIVLISLLVGCQQASPLRTPTLPPASTSATLPILPTMTALPTITATPTKARSLTTLESSCLDVINNQPGSSVKDGNLVLFDRKKKELYTDILSSGKKSILYEANPNIVSISPDRKWLSYITGTFLHIRVKIRSFDSDSKKNITIDTNMVDKRLILSEWANNETLIFSRYPDENYIDQPLTLIALNPFTQEKRELPPDFPNIYNNDPWGWGNSGRTLYSPDFQYVIYFSTGEPSGYLLWDTQKGKSLASIETMNPRLAPQWRFDGKGFFVITDADFSYANTDGKSGRLTDFGKLFLDKNIKIRTWSQSPDSRYIAFFMSTASGGQIIDDRLMVLDVQNGQSSDYCIPGDTNQVDVGIVGYSLAPIWSPDGEALLIENRYELEKSRLILVDLVHKTATQIAEDSAPFGWMLLP